MSPTDQPEIRHPSQSEAAWDVAIGASFEVPDETAMAAAEIPESIGKYRILREIGRGGMGVVYLAEHTSLHRPVALKVLTAHDKTAEALERFRREAESIAALDHPGIVRVHDNGSDGAHHFIEMELIEGSPLDLVMTELRKRHPDDLEAVDGAEFGEAVRTCTRHTTPASDLGTEWDPSYVKQICQLGASIAGALQHAHDHQVVHRDVKPSNILVRPDGSAVLTDFGLAFELQRPGITQTGVLACTPHYASPEQARGDKAHLDHRTDIFSLGVTLYELLTLRRPFDAATTEEILAKIQRSEPVNPRRLYSKLPRDLATIVLKALEKDPERRYATAAALAADLRAFLAFQPITARPTSLSTRALRFARRRRAPLLTATAVLVLSLGSWAYFTRPMTVTIRCVHPDQTAVTGAITLRVDDKPYGSLANPATVQLTFGARQLRARTGSGESPAETVDGWPMQTISVELTIVANTPAPQLNPSESRRHLDQLKGLLESGTEPGDPAVHKHLDDLNGTDRDLAVRMIEAATRILAATKTRRGEIEAILDSTGQAPAEFAKTRREALTRIRALGSSLEPFGTFFAADQAARHLLSKLGDQVLQRAEVETDPDHIRDMLALLEEVVRGDPRAPDMVGRIEKHLDQLEADARQKRRQAKAEQRQHRAELFRGALRAFEAGQTDALDTALKQLVDAGSPRVHVVTAALDWLVRRDAAEARIADDPVEAHRLCDELQVEQLDSAFVGPARRHVEALSSAVMARAGERVTELTTAIDAAAVEGDAEAASFAGKLLPALAIHEQAPAVRAALRVVAELDREARDIKESRTRLQRYLETRRSTGAPAAKTELQSLRSLWRRMLIGLDARLAKHPDENWRRLLRARLHLRLGGTAAALRDAALLSGSVDGLLIRGQATYLQGDSTAAAKFFAKILEHDAGNGRARYWLGTCRYGQADRDQTRAQLRRASTTGGDCADLHYLLALLHIRDRSHTKAAAEATIALESAPLTEDMMLRVSRVTAPDADWFDVFLGDAYATRAQAHLKLNQFARCLDDCDRSIACNPTSGHPWLYRGAAYGAQGKRANAIKSLQKALGRLDPASKQVARQMLDVLKRQEKDAKKRR